MINTDLSSKYTSDKEETLLLRRINDLLNQSRKQYSAVYSHFLDPAQQMLIGTVDEFSGYIDFVGGYDDAERRLCRVCCEKYCNDEGSPIVIFSVSPTMKGVQLSHRDVLGSLMGLGIKREMIGDIITGGNTAQFFCHSSAAEHVELSLEKISRYNVTLKRISTADIIPPAYKERTINVSSMRLDCIASECFGISRSKAAEQIKKGLAAVNWTVTTDVSKEIKPGDRITLRGKGKANITSISGVSKKGRLFVTISVPEIR